MQEKGVCDISDGSWGTGPLETETRLTWVLSVSGLRLYLCLRCRKPLERTLPFARLHPAGLPTPAPGRGSAADRPGKSGARSVPRAESKPGRLETGICKVSGETRNKLSQRGTL